MTKLESKFQADLIKELYFRFPGCVVIKTDPSYIQGFPDLLILYNNKWAALECKKSSNAHHQPNQDDWVMRLYYMSYASFVYPENKEQVLYALQNAFSS